MKTVRITALGTYLPERIVNVQDVKVQEKLTDSKIERMKIGTVHVSSPEETPTSMAIEAGKAALANSSLSPDEIDLVIYSFGFLPDYLAYPDHARVQDGLGIKHATSFTVGQGCNGLIEAMEIAKAFLETGRYRNILIAGADKGHPLFGNRWHATSYCVMGEGAAAAILSLAEEGIELLSTYSVTDGFYSDINYVEFGLAAVPDPDNFDFGRLRYDTIPQAIRFWEARGGQGLEFLDDYQKNQRLAIEGCLAPAGLSLSEVDFIVDYNMSYEINKALFDSLNYPIERTAIGLHEEFGHMGPTDILLNLSVVMERGLVKKGDTALLIGAGSGLTWGNCLVRI